MKLGNYISFLFYTLSTITYLFLFQQQQTHYSLAFYIFLFILFRKKLSHKFSALDRKLFFIASLFFFHIVFPIDLSQSITEIQLLILSRKIFSLTILLSSFLLFFFFTYQNDFYLSYINPSNLSLKSIKLLKEKKVHYINLYDDSRDKLNRENVRYLITEIPRHGYLNYTSQNNISENFFTLSERAIQEDNRLYIILSNTGSPASEVLSLFTNKEFNHLSLSFDRDLKTLISYNGGNSLQNPGLNMEDLNSLHQKQDSQVLVYSLKATKKQKQDALEVIKRINKEGSSYNVLGLLTNHSIRPNMMFCSQFVYSVLQEVGLDFFDDGQTQVKPTDFIEKDDQQKMTFEYQIDFPILPYEKIS